MHGREGQKVGRRTDDLISNFLIVNVTPTAFFRGWYPNRHTSHIHGPAAQWVSQSRSHIFKFEIDNNRHELFNLLIKWTNKYKLVAEENNTDHYTALQHLMRF